MADEFAIIDAHHDRIRALEARVRKLEAKLCECAKNGGMNRGGGPVFCPIHDVDLLAKLREARR